MKNKKKIGIIATCLVGAVAVTYALFTTSFSVGNRFKINDASAEFVEEFNAPKEGEIVAGNTYKKSGKVINNGDVAVKARAKISISWLDNNDATITNNPPTGDLGNNQYAYTLNFGSTVSDVDAKAFQTASTDKFGVSASGANTGIWEYETDGFFYYKGTTGTIPANTTSTSLLESISFNALLAETTTTKNYYVKDDTNNTPFDSQEKAKVADTQNKGIIYKETSTMTYPDYKDKTLVVTLSGEVIDADSTWK